MKTCTKCKEAKESTEFYKKGTQCKVCFSVDYWEKKLAKKSKWQPPHGNSKV